MAAASNVDRVAADLAAAAAQTALQPDAFAALFVYAGSLRGVPIGSDSQPAASQVMQSPDKRRWIVLTDLNSACGSCRAPLNQCNQNEMPFCHRAFALRDVTRAVALAAQLAGASTLTAFVVAYSAALANEDDVDADSQDVREQIVATHVLSVATNDARKPPDALGASSDALSPASEWLSADNRWLLLALGVGSLLLIACLIALCSSRRSPAACQHAESPAAPVVSAPRRTMRTLPVLRGGGGGGFE